LPPGLDRIAEWLPRNLAALDAALGPYLYRVDGLGVIAADRQAGQVPSPGLWIRAVAFCLVLSTLEEKTKGTKHEAEKSREPYHTESARIPRVPYQVGNMFTCPSCGSTRVSDPDASCPDCGARTDPEERIASWLEGPAGIERPGAVAAEPVCTACGYAGDMIVDADRGVVTCPACLVAIPPRRDAKASKVVRVLECPGCGQGIGLSEADARKTVICPSCSYFLGAVPVRGGAG
jgi:hypothetical protein